MNREDWNNAWLDPMKQVFEERYAKEAAIDMEKEKKSLTQALAESMRVSKNVAINNVCGALPPRPPIDPNDLPAYNTPIATLKTMWRVRFGERWVSQKEVSGDTFYAHALARLDSLNAMETFHGGERFVRLREDA